MGTATLTPVPAVDGVGDHQVSWIISANGRRILHAGDTLWHGSWWRIGRLLGPFDVAFLPVNGAQLPSMQPSSEAVISMRPEEAVAAAVVMGSKLAVPIHYGLTASGDYRETPNAEATFIKEASRREVAASILKPGEWLTI